MAKRGKEIRKHMEPGMELHEVAERSNPILRGWVNYYGVFDPSHLRKSLLRSFDDNVLAWWAVCQEVVQEMKVARPFVTG
ncbi:group II intron maturase-specific domain-containing protein [Pasteuria penetrans]|uniref:group II intron maturase-specific domain-containing protein n=1 Tax=Pasteuria penetrans TaxID=86005 RepID=UPI00248211D5|nr:group II intron maturase-specific domain-containing protein [Pasteuria penetrans]